MNNNVYKGDVQPNHKEYSVWVDNKGSIKAFDGNAWKASGIPIVEELDPTATIGSVVCYKQTVTVDKEVATINKTGSVRDLNYQIIDPSTNPNEYFNTKGDVITKINFLTPDVENIHSKFKNDVGCAIAMYDGSMPFIISVYWNMEDQVFVTGYSAPNQTCPLIYNNQVDQEGMKILEDRFNTGKIYYCGVFYAPNHPLTIEECFDFFDYFITVDTTEEIKTTEEISKVIPHIKQEYGWESLEVTDKDFNNDFNFDFD